jgi:pilus assembly protein CpaB
VSELAERISSSRLFSTRGGTIAVGVFASLLALLVLLLYLSHYRSSIKNSSAPVPVLVANRLIPQGTAGDVLGTSGGFAATDIAKSSVKEGAITDPALLKGRVAVADIYPGQQLTALDFTPTAGATLGSKLTGRQRAMTVPIDSSHGMIGTIVAGDRVDIFANLSGVIRAVLQDVLVLGVGGSTGGGVGDSGGGNTITFRLTPMTASKLALASDNGTLWVVLRPATRGGRIGPSVSTLQQVLTSPVVPGGH